MMNYNLVINRPNYDRRILGAFSKKVFGVSKINVPFQMRVTFEWFLRKVARVRRQAKGPAEVSGRDPGVVIAD